MQSLGSRESFLVQNVPMSTPPKFCKASGCLNPSIFIYLLGNSDLEAQWSQDIWGHCPGGAQVGFVPLTIPSPTLIGLPGPWAGLLKAQTGLLSILTE